MTTAAKAGRAVIYDPMMLIPHGKQKPAVPATLSPAGIQQVTRAFESILYARSYTAMWKKHEFVTKRLTTKDPFSPLPSPALQLSRDGMVRRFEVLGQCLHNVCMIGAGNENAIKAEQARMGAEKKKLQLPPRMQNMPFVNIFHGPDGHLLTVSGVNISRWYGLRAVISHNYNNVDYRLLWNRLFSKETESTLRILGQLLKNSGAPIPEI